MGEQITSYSDEKNMAIVLSYYFSNGEWNKVYDLIVFAVENFADASVVNDYIERSNFVLAEEGSGYRIINGVVASISSPQEVQEIAEALSMDGALEPVSFHLQRALELFADRDKPDCRTSIKESISAVESMAKLISGMDNTVSG